MAATQKSNIWAFQARDGSRLAPAKVTKKIAASQSDYIAGTLFYENTSGTIKKSDTSDGNGDLYQFQALVAQTSELSANTEVKGYTITDNILFCVMVENNDSDAAAAQANIGNEYGVRIATGAGKKGYVTLDVNNSNAAFHVTNIWANIFPYDPNYGSTSDSPGIAIGYFLPSVINTTRS